MSRKVVSCEHFAGFARLGILQPRIAGIPRLSYLHSGTHSSHLDAGVIGGNYSLYSTAERGFFQHSAILFVQGGPRTLAAGSLGRAVVGNAGPAHPRVGRRLLCVSERHFTDKSRESRVSERMIACQSIGPPKMRAFKIS